MLSKDTPGKQNKDRFYILEVILRCQWQNTFEAGMFCRIQTHQGLFAAQIIQSQFFKLHAFACELFHKHFIG